MWRMNMEAIMEFMISMGMGYFLEEDFCRNKKKIFIGELLRF